MKRIETVFACSGLRVSMLVALVMVLQGCATGQTVRSAIDAYEKVAPTVELGQHKDQVLAVLLPTQEGLSAKSTRPPESYLEDSKRVEVYFFRIRTFSDGLLTDDEFIPYVFREGVLEAIGWTAIGGPKTQAQNRNSDSGVHFGTHLHYGHFH